CARYAGGSRYFDYW
nr:immunoglobulin heavy chain junction region [Macaca mulatta]